jgi:hypothetical protein
LLCEIPAGDGKNDNLYFTVNDEEERGKIKAEDEQSVLEN